MNRILKGTISFSKLALLVIRPHLLLGFVIRPFTLVANTLRLTRWAARQERKSILNDFPVLRRDYARRYQLYAYLTDQKLLANIPITYLEFGVSGGYSFRWWLSANMHPQSQFFGFDTFEGLPEDWGAGFSKGDMAANIPEVSDNRAVFIKGLFQETLGGFLKEKQDRLGGQLILHLDADLFTSTLFALSSMAPYLKKGDILIFDEFCVPNHEFNACRIFMESYYIKMTLAGAVNNYFQVAFEVE
jgi:O-methyltransferase